MRKGPQYLTPSFYLRRSDWDQSDGDSSSHSGSGRTEEIRMDSIAPLHFANRDKRVLQRIAVTDNNGDRGTVSVIEFTELLNDGRRRTLIGYSLHTGQPASFVDADTFQLADSGKRLHTLKAQSQRARTAKTKR